MIDIKKAAIRLHHLGMRYIGALAEVARGQEIAFLPQDHPGVHEMRDLIGLLLFTRAELNGLTRILVEAKIVTPERLTEIMAEEYDHFATAKAEALGVEVTDVGIKIKLGGDLKHN